VFDARFPTDHKIAQPNQGIELLSQA
jgi:hypothetical protein